MAMNSNISRRRVIQLLAGAGAAMTLPKTMTKVSSAATPAAVGAAPAPTTAPVPAIPPAPEYVLAPAGFGVADGPYKPTWDSLSNYKVPDWYRDAKFGIWAHWGPQCQPEMGDWYAQRMYKPSDSAYKFHVKKYGHPSAFGFKDVINEWKAEAWAPEKLIALYKKAGAKYFAAMANHHDNMDMFDSTYQEWNSVRIGPKKDIVGGWMKAARAAGLRFAISCHGDRAWDWMQVSRDSDPSGPMIGIPYDGFVTKADGKGKWWEGLDPQHLYAQYHPRGRYGWNLSGNPPLDKAYVEKFFNRTIDLINKYQPDLLYFDDTVLPIYPSSDIGLRIAAYLYNTNIARLGNLEAVMTGKGLNPQQRKALVLDVERGVTNGGEALPWQTDTCIGSWHYQRSVYDNHKYKTAAQVIQMLIDIVSKNGNLMLNIPLPGNGVPDEDELKVLDGLAKWIEHNGEGIYGTRPWAVYGEGPSATTTAPRGRFGGAQDVRPYTADDIRFMRKGDVVFAFVMGWPANGKVLIKSLATGSTNFPGQIGKVELLGSMDGVTFTRDESALIVSLPQEKPNDVAYGLKITPA
jgi:alpha-L-fucosidase